jgi:hypothetical protein
MNDRHLRTVKLIQRKALESLANTSLEAPWTPCVRSRWRFATSG